jgi:hypothetical protein
MAGLTAALILSANLQFPSIQLSDENCLALTSSKSSITGELIVANFFEPFGGFPAESFLNCDVRHGCRRGGAMPVFLARRKPDDIAGENFLDRTAVALGPAAASSDDKRLSERMRVPSRPGAGSECDVGACNTSRIDGLKKSFDLDVAREVFGGAAVGLPAAVSLDIHRMPISSLVDAAN